MNMLINLSVRSKIIILASTLIIAALTLTATGISSLQSIGNELHDITSNDMPLTKSMTSITEHQLEQSITMEKALRYGNVLAEEKTAREGYQKALEEFKKLGATVDEELKEAEKIAKQGLDTAHNKEQIEEFTKLLTQIIALEKAHASYDRKVEAIFQLVAKNNLHEAALAAEEVEKLEEQLNKDLSNVLAEVEKFTADAIDTVEKEEAKAISTMSIVTIVGMIIGVTLSLAIISSIVRGLNKAVSASERIAQGDLTQDLQAHSSDEIGKLISSM
ncbi:MAG: HAMP domain-containing protein, partial [Gammaproteobacteria bacterium]|nr:HAMP domain-containing protein [Gammaproteobacteria bacterium]